MHSNLGLSNAFSNHIYSLIKRGRQKAKVKDKHLIEEISPKIENWTEKIIVLWTK